MRLPISFAFAALFAWISSTGAFADGDAALGKKVFAKCMACHDAKAEKDKVGPHLVGVFGRSSGTSARCAARSTCTESGTSSATAPGSDDADPTTSVTRLRPCF